MDIFYVNRKIFMKNKGKLSKKPNSTYIGIKGKELH